MCVCLLVLDLMRAIMRLIRVVVVVCFVRLKRKGAGTGTKQTKKRAAKDPNKPKRPPTAFFVFMYRLSLIFLFFFRIQFFFRDY